MLAKAMGFTGVRKHQKVEDPRYLYWADLLGLLVWEEMPSAYRFTKRSVTRLTRNGSRSSSATGAILHRGVGSVQRIVGGPQLAAERIRAGLRASALSLDQDSRPHPTGDWQ